MKRLCILWLLLIASCSSKLKVDDCIGEPLADMVCTMEYDPVCGCDGKIYSNACSAEGAGIKSFTKGACD